MKSYITANNYKNLELPAEISKHSVPNCNIK